MLQLKYKESRVFLSDNKTQLSVFVCIPKALCAVCTKLKNTITMLRNEVKKYLQTNDKWVTRLTENVTHCTIHK